MCMEACGAAGWSVERPGPLSGAVCAVVQVVGAAAARRKALVEAVTNMYLQKKSGCACEERGGDEGWLKESAGPHYCPVK